MKGLVTGGLAATLSFAASQAQAIDADPSTYEAIVPTLQPGDVLTLAAGDYPRGLTIDGIDGTEAMPIVIEGPASGEARMLGEACCNTIEISNASHVVLRRLFVDGQGIPAPFGVSAQGGVVHHVTVEDCTFVGYGGAQQIVAISTKVPTWGWIIRHNLIDQAGTGMYLGNSDGTDPFVAGLIEGNLIRNTVGYNMQIKFQTAWPTDAGLPTEPTATIIRHNVFIKDDRPSEDGDRPNVLVGGFPESGPGSENHHEIYGNFFFRNPREAHLQGSGRLSVHDNVFVDAANGGVVVTDHDLPLRRAHVYNNTFYATGTGIRFGSPAPEGDFVAGNLIFGDAATSGTIAVAHDNLLFPIGEAATVVENASLVLGAMSFYPRPGQAQGAALDLSSVSSDADFDRDFNGTSKGAFTYRGAYAGEGQNPGWPLDDGFKEGVTSGGVTSATGASGAQTNGGSGAGNGTSAASGIGSTGGAGGGGNVDEGDDGCGCRVSRGASPFGAGVVGMMVLVGLALRRRLV